jgi:hypothetical protein
VGEAPIRAEYARLGALLGKSEPSAESLSGEALAAETLARSRTLSAQIRAGDWDDPTAFGRAFAHTQVTVIDKLHVSNPRYLKNFVKPE